MRLLLLTDWTFPCDHAFLSAVYNGRLSTRGHEIVWVMRPDGDRSTVRSTSWDGNPVYVLPSDAYSPVRVAAGRALRQRSHPVFDIVEREGPFDAVQVRNDLAMGLVGRRVAAEQSVPYVHQISHLKAETLFELAEFQPLSRRPALWAKGTLGRILRRRLCRDADLVLPISDAMRSRLLRDGYEPPLPPVPTAVDTSVDPASVDTARVHEQFALYGNHQLIYAGSMSPVRRLEFLFDVLAELDRPDVGLLMVGGRREAERERLEVAARERGVADAVTFTGWISDDDLLRGAIRTADVGLSPLPPGTVLETNAPFKILEYLALKTPVVATDTPNQRSVVRNSGGGQIAAYDAAAFARSIEELLLLPSDERREMGRRGREYVRDERSVEVLTDRVLSIYREHEIVGAEN